MMMMTYLRYDRKSFPLVFEYPTDARYAETTRKKYSIQVNLRETKEKFRRLSPEEIEKNRAVGGGTIAAVFPKISITWLKAYVPAWQRAPQDPRFMDFEAYVSFYIGGHFHPSNFCQEVLDTQVDIPFGKGRMATFRHPSDTFFRSQIYVVDHLDPYRFLNILYQHRGSGLSLDERDHILQSIQYRHPDVKEFDD